MKISRGSYKVLQNCHILASKLESKVKFPLIIVSGELKAQGPQKKYGGPHAAHGSLFGHVCSTSYFVSVGSYLLLSFG